MDDLPYIDEHAVPTNAAPARVWAALVRFLSNDLAGGLTPAFARLVGCEPVRKSAHFTGAVGDTIPGFRVTRAEPGQRLDLEGQHRFSRYQLTFLVDPDGQLRAQSRAKFPGLRGRAYHALVIGSGGHRVITRGMLKRIARAVR